jgi:hypothetical protein
MIPVRKTVDFPIGRDSTVTYKGVKTPAKSYTHIKDRKAVELAKMYARALAVGTLDKFREIPEWGTAVKNGWIDLMFETDKAKDRATKFSRDEVIERAKSFPSRSLFRSGDPAAFFCASLAHGLLDEIYPKAGDRYTIDQVKAVAAKYPTMTAMRLAAFPYYNAALKNDWLSQLMFAGGSGAVRWDKEKCAEEAMKHRSRSDFATGHQYAYNLARREGWLDEFFPPATSGNWTREVTFEYLKRDGVRGLLAYNPKWLHHAISAGWVDAFIKERTLPERSH